MEQPEYEYDDEIDDDYSFENAYTVVLLYVCPGRRIVDGKFG